MEKGLKPSSLPTANSELLAFLWRSKPVLMAQPKRLNRISELQMTRRSSFRKQTHTIVVSFSFYKSEATGLVQEREMVWSESNAGKRLHFSFVSNRAPCVSAQTLSRVSQLCPRRAAVSLARRACSNMYKRALSSPWQPAPPSFRPQHFPSSTDFQTFQ